MILTGNLISGTSIAPLPENGPTPEKGSYHLRGNPLSEDRLIQMMREVWDKIESEPNQLWMSVSNYRALRRSVARWTRTVHRRTRCTSRMKSGHHQARCR